MSALNFITTALSASSLVADSDDLVIPIEFLAADSPTVEIGTIVTGRFGVGRVRSIKVINGETGYSVTRLYRTSIKWIEPPFAAHLWVWSDEVEVA